MKRTTLLLLGAACAAAMALPAQAATQPAAAKSASAPAAAAPAASSPMPRNVPSAPKGPLVDLNNASKAQLLKLPGIDDAKAERIMATRPYNSKADMVTKGGVPAGIYQSIRRQVYVGRPGQGKGTSAQKSKGKS